MTARVILILVPLLGGCDRRRAEGTRPPRTHLVRADLDRWAREKTPLGLGCLDEPVREALRRTAAKENVQRRRAIFNATADEVVSDPSSLAIYFVEGAAQPDGLDRTVRGQAMTFRVDLAGSAVPVIVVDTNLVRWMGQRMGSVLGSAKWRKSPTEFVRELADRRSGGFGDPITQIGASPLVDRRCRGVATSTDIAVLQLAVAETLWTVRHEMHHSWNPPPSAGIIGCPSAKDLAVAVQPEIEADSFAIRAAGTDSVAELVAAGEGSGVDTGPRSRGQDLPPEATNVAIAYAIAHHEVGAISERQAWIAAGRLRAAARRLALGELIEGLEFQRALRIAVACPDRADLDIRCRACRDSPSACGTSVELAWRCLGGYAGAPETASAQAIRLEELKRWLKPLGYAPTKVEDYRDRAAFYRLDPAGEEPGDVILAVVFGFPAPAEPTQATEEELQAGFEQGGARHFGGFALFRDKSRGSGTPTLRRKLIQDVARWDTEIRSRECVGDVAACRRGGGTRP